MTSKELREQRAPLAVVIRQMADKSNDADHKWGGEDEANWDKANDDYNALTSQIERAERAEQVEGVQKDIPGLEDRNDGEPENRPAPAGREATEEDRALSIQAWCSYQSGNDLTDRQREAAELCGINPRARDLDIPLIRSGHYDQYRRDMRTTNYTSTTATQGGDAVPPGSLIGRIEAALLAFGGVRQVASVLRTASGEPLEFPTVNDTSNTGELISEAADSDDSAVSDQNVTTANVTLNAYKISSKLVRVTSELLTDSAVDLVAFLGDMLGERIARKENALCTTGTGSSQHNGIVVASTAGKTAASVSAITADELIDLLHSVDPAYRIDAGWMTEDATVKIIRKLKDSDNQYLWSPGLQAGVPDMLLGFPVTINQDMASVAANAKSVLFGALGKYLIRDVGSIRLRRLVERYAEYDQEGFVAFHRSDADLLNAGTNPVKHLLHPAS